ncbi:hypothetical protein OS493_038022 [Desmophyllum pertusum]|uniref:1-aminocyclopropane-1-carboxylate deaminase n=1 Tax=Desmophyllum pertusum TaxID=174260 RepID=A0A9X0D6K8_9CNID|nr:hypothetical protein OS493_038022 [Desmophyllum pertusum]
MDINNSPLHQYEPPSWASSLKNIPQHFVKTTAGFISISDRGWRIFIHRRVWLPDGISRNDESENILEITSTTGVLVDPVYNIKAIRGMLAEMNHNPGRFQGRRILYIHTGGLFGLFDGRIDPLITSSQSAKCANEVFCWRDINEPPPC